MPRESGQTRLLRALRDTDRFPVFVHPGSFVRLLNQRDTYKLVEAALSDPKYPRRDQIIDAALRALNEMETVQ